MAQLPTQNIHSEEEIEEAKRLLISRHEAAKQEGDPAQRHPGWGITGVLGPPLSGKGLICNDWLTHHFALGVDVFWTPGSGLLYGEKIPEAYPDIFDKFVGDREDFILFVNGIERTKNANLVEHLASGVIRRKRIHVLYTLQTYGSQSEIEAIGMYTRTNTESVLYTGMYPGQTAKTNTRRRATRSQGIDNSPDWCKIGIARFQNYPIKPKSYLDIRLGREPQIGNPATLHADPGDVFEASKTYDAWSDSAHL